MAEVAAGRAELPGRAEPAVVQRSARPSCSATLGKALEPDKERAVADEAELVGLPFALRPDFPSENLSLGSAERSTPAERLRQKLASLEGGAELRLVLALARKRGICLFPSVR